MIILGPMDDSCSRHIMFAILDQEVIAEFETDRRSFRGKVLNISKNSVQIEFRDPGKTSLILNAPFQYQSFKKITIIEGDSND